MRCAGCGARVETGYIKRFHYCDYLGKYFCPRCHTNKMAVIPARVIRRWDLAKRSVSNFAYDLLARMFDDPLFDVQSINPNLRYKARDLDTARSLKKQLGHLNLFLQTCRAATTYVELYKIIFIHFIEMWESISLFL